MTQLHVTNKSNIYSPILTSEGSKARRVYDVAREMEFRKNTTSILPIKLR